jgi:hypothetical protein
MKATAQEYNFHQRILANDDPVAFAQLAECLYFPLVQDIQQRARSHADPALVEEAAGQALLDYRDAPTRYDPDRASLRSYLAMAAYRDYQNEQAKELRMQAHQISLFDPTLQESVESLESMELAEIIASKAQAEELWQFIQELFHDPLERRIIALIINRVHAPEPYAQILGIEDVSHEKQIEQIKLVKYRITRRLRRRIAQRFQLLEGDRS